MDLSNNEFLNWSLWGGGGWEGRSLDVPVLEHLSN